VADNLLGEAVLLEATQSTDVASQPLQSSGDMVADQLASMSVKTLVAMFQENRGKWRI
jgi:hypothetical protein